MKDTLTQTKIKEFLNYNPETGVFTWKINQGRAQVGAIAGSVTNFGYIMISIDGVAYQAHRLAWLYHHGEFPTLQLDHVNHIKSDNRIVNLREVTASENSQNRPSRKDNKSGFRGVSWHNRSNRWQATIVLQRKQTHLGYFDTPEQADAAYKAAAELLHTHRPVKQ